MTITGCLSEWIREMKRYGILPETAGADNKIDAYNVEKKYWESLWCVPKN